jgi:hypothetical protein
MISLDPIISARERFDDAIPARIVADWRLLRRNNMFSG